MVTLINEYSKLTIIYILPLGPIKLCFSDFFNWCCFQCIKLITGFGTVGRRVVKNSRFESQPINIYLNTFG